MIEKLHFQKQIESLLESANRRDTGQGVKVYTIALDKLKGMKAQGEIDELLQKFNKAMAGLEAHGSFTEDEYKIVMDLRKLE